VATPLIKVLCNESGPAIEWLIEKFGIDLSLVTRMGGHSMERTHRGKEKFPGMTITYALMEKFEEIEKDTKGEFARLLTRCKATKLLKNGDEIIGVEYVTKKGETK
jgi:tyrosyl-tRNA synthetase